MNMTTRQIEILLIEDNPGDIVLTQEAFRESNLKTNMNVVGDGASAIEYLSHSGQYSGSASPDLILLDLNLPKLSGREVLELIKTHEHWKMIPVIMLTTSESEHDVNDAYLRHVNCYITKPMAFDPFIEVIRKIEGFWLGLARLPHSSSRN
ncbi:MAG TPA: response regulator [Flavobacteriales bacterium]|nr:response regulator [Flavobacteriales bacterium]